MVCAGLSARIRTAGCPTSGSPSVGKWTTDGVNRAPFLSAIRIGNPASITPMSELVVPRSMPTISFIVIDPEKKSETNLDSFIHKTKSQNRTVSDADLIDPHPSLLPQGEGIFLSGIALFNSRSSVQT